MSDQTVQDRLDSWKDIAAYLKRDVSTVQRWEKREGMPVHRHLHDKIGSVYAFPSELDEWARSRRSAARDEPVATPVRRSSRILIAALFAVAILAALIYTFRPRATPPASPLASARFVHLTDFEGTEEAAAISRDGRFVAFLSDRGGQMDVWLTQIGSGQFHNLTKGRIGELVNPDIRTLGFSPDGAQVLAWIRRQTADGTPDISIWAIPTLGGEPKLYLEGAAELDWSPDEKRVVYHTPAPGDPLFVKSGDEPGRRIFTAASGLHNHYPRWSPSGDAIYFSSGAVPKELDVWRMNPDGKHVERLTSHKSRVTDLVFLDRATLLYLATDAAGAGPWLYALDTERRATRRISFGVERYTSLSGSADGRRLVVTVATPRRTLWRAPVGEKPADEAAAARLAVPVVGGRSPRVGPGYILYVSSRSGAESIWKLTDGKASDIWTGTRIIGGPSIAADGARIAFTADTSGKTRTYVMNADGSGVRAMPETLDPSGAPAWSPDGRSLVVAAQNRLAKVDVNTLRVTPLGAEVAFDPVWVGDTIFYSGAEVGTTFPVRAIRADGSAAAQTKMTLSRGVRRLSLLGNSIVVLRGDMSHKNLWAIDLANGQERQLTNFGPDVAIRDFDVAGEAIVFDREQDNGDVVLIER